MPKYVGYIIASVLLVLFAELLIHTVYEKTGYEDTIKKEKKKHRTLSNKDSNKKKNKVTKRKKAAPATDTSKVFVEKTYPKVKSNKESKRPEQSVSVTNTKTSDKAYFEQLKSNYLPQYTNGLEEGQFRSDIVIRYYKHTPDGEKVFELKQLKYYIHERDAADVDVSSNALFYGKSVNTEDIKIVAYTLLTNGLKIKRILPSKYGTGWKANSIEIGVDSSYDNEKALTLADVRAFLK